MHGGNASGLHSVIRIVSGRPLKRREVRYVLRPHSGAGIRLRASVRGSRCPEIQERRQILFGISRRLRDIIGFGEHDTAVMGEALQDLFRGHIIPADAYYPHLRVRPVSLRDAHELLGLIRKAAFCRLSAADDPRYGFSFRAGAFCEHRRDIIRPCAPERSCRHRVYRQDKSQHDQDCRERGGKPFAALSPDKCFFQRCDLSQHESLRSSCLFARIIAQVLCLLQKKLHKSQDLYLSVLPD